MTAAPVVLGTDVLSELSRGRPAVTEHARDYLARHGRLTITSITVFERLRGYEVALRAGKPYQRQMRQFERFVMTCRVLPVDAAAAALAARIWAASTARVRHALADIFIAAVAASRGLPLATRNRKEFAPIAGLPFMDLDLVSWTRRPLR